MNSKKGLVGIALTFPVFIFLILIMALFLSLVFFTSTFKKPQVQKAIEVSETKNLLTKNLSVLIENQKEEILLLDALALFEQNKIEKQNLIEALKTLLNEKENCVAIAKSETENSAGRAGHEENDDVFIKLNNENDYIVSSIGTTFHYFSDLKKENSLTKTSLQTEDKKIYIEYYYGSC